MPRLFVLSGPEIGATHDIVGRAQLGRSPHCEVRLRHPSVSRRHAALSPVERDEQGDGEQAGEETWLVEDLDSRNGVRVAGRKVARAELRDGDEFELGELLLRFRLSIPAFADELQPAPAEEPRAAAPTAASGDALRTEPEIEPEDLSAELSLEGEDLLDDLPGVAAPNVDLRRREPGGALADPAGEDAAAPELDERARLILSMQRDSRGGVLSAELSQRPWPIRLALTLLAVAIASALAYGAYRGVLSLRS